MPPQQHPTPVAPANFYLGENYDEASLNIFVARFLVHEYLELIPEVTPHENYSNFPEVRQQPQYRYSGSSIPLRQRDDRGGLHSDPRPWGW